MENAMQFLDELREKYKKEVEQAIDDWDYQDFSPDKRCALLDEEIVSSIAEDERRVEASAANTVKSPTSDWTGLTPDAELAELDTGVDGDSAALGFEARLVALSSPPGGIQGMPDVSGLQRLLAYAPRLEAPRVTAALAARLGGKSASGSWQVRAKTLVVMQLLVESKPLAARFLPAFRADVQLLRAVDLLRTTDRNATVRESARKLLSLIGSNGANPMLIPRQTPPAKPHIRHHRLTSSSTARPPATAQPSISTAKTAIRKATGLVTKPATEKPAVTVNTVSSAAPTSSSYQHTSPKIARAAMASWRRRSMTSRHVDGAHLMPFQQPSTWVGAKGGVGGETTPPAAPSAIMVTGSASRYNSGQLTSFAFMR